MRWLAAGLLLINLAVGGYFLWAQSQSNSQAVAYSPVNADKIIMLSARLASEQPTKPQHTESTQPGEPICVEWRGLNAADLDKGRKAVKDLTAKHVLSVEELPVDRMYWVIFPPLPTEAASQVKLKEMTALKVKEALIIKDAPWQNGLSLGLYSSEDAARRHMRELEAKGVTGLRLETKPKEGSAYYYVVKSEDTATLRDLDDIRATLPATTVTRVACKK